MDLARESYKGMLKYIECIVSILVLMDLAREFIEAVVTLYSLNGFNPCFNGSCSRIFSMSLIS